MKINEKIILILLFTSVVGICAGAFFEVYMTGDTKNQIIDLLDSFFSSESNTLYADTDFSRIFVRSLAENLLIAATIITAPYIMITLPLIPFLILLKSIASGFSVAMTLEVIGLRGILHIVLFLLPYNIISIPVLCIIGGISLQSGIMRCTSFLMPFSAEHRRKRKALHQDARHFSLYYSIALAALIISCILEAFLLQLKI